MCVFYLQFESGLIMQYLQINHTGFKKILICSQFSLIHSESWLTRSSWFLFTHFSVISCYEIVMGYCIRQKTKGYLSKIHCRKTCNWFLWLVSNEEDLYCKASLYKYTHYSTNKQTNKYCDTYFKIQKSKY